MPLRELCHHIRHRQSVAEGRKGEHEFVKFMRFMCRTGAKFKLRHILYLYSRVEVKLGEMLRPLGIYVFDKYVNYYAISECVPSKSFRSSTEILTQSFT